MHLSRQRAAVRCLIALALGLAALTGCGGADDGQAADTEPVTSATSSASAHETVPTTAPDGDAAAWAGSRQFVQIDDAWTSGGRTYLSVRPAQKEAHVTDHSEAWVVVPGEGPYTEVPLADDAQVLLSAPLGDGSHASSYTQAEFVSRLMAQSSSERSLVGYDLSFDGEGQVTRVESLYTS
ncbi:hypothetical protein [Streptomyces mayteni]